MVEEVHDYHVWTLSVGKVAMSCHVRSEEPKKALRRIKALMKDKYEIDHITVQIEESNGEMEDKCCELDQ